MKKVLVLLAMVLGATNMYAQDYDLKGLAKACDEYYVYQSGFHDGLAKVRNKNGTHIGYINTKGELVIPFEYQDGTDFQFGKARITLLDGSYKYIDKNGNDTKSMLDLFPDYKYINGKGFWGFVDIKGQTVVRHKYEGASDFRFGLARVKLNDKYFFIDRMDKVRTDHFTEMAEFVSDGFIRYKQNSTSANNYSPKWGFLSCSESPSIQAVYSTAYDFSEGLAYVEQYSNDDLWSGFIDKKGNKVFRTEYNVNSNFNDGLVMVANEDGKVGYINRNGKLVIPFKYDRGSDFSEGLALVCLVDTVNIKEKWGFVDKYGNSTFNPPTSSSTSQKTDDGTNTATETMPSFVGGQRAMFRWISEHLQYPEEAMNKGIKGRVVASFYVEKDGTIGNVEIEKSVHPLLDNETIRLLKSMPKWIPGTQDGRPVRAKYTVPLTYNFTEE